MTRHTCTRAMVALLLLILAGCSTVSERMKRSIERGAYGDAILAGSLHLQDAPESAERSAVEALIEEARYREAIRVDNVDRYRAFLAEFPDSIHRPVITKGLEKVTFEKITRKTDTSEAYAAFLKEFPEGGFADQARERSATLAFRSVDAVGTVEAYAGFEATYPGHVLSDAARHKRWSLLWLAAENAGTPAAFMALAKELSGTPIADAAAIMVERLRWDAATAENTAEAYLAFTRSHPASAAASAARTRGLALGWMDATRANTAEGYHSFRTIAETQPMTGIAYQREVDLAWKNAEQKDNEDIYRWYAIRYNGTAQARVAEKRAADLAYFNSPWNVERPLGRVNQIYDGLPDAVRIYADVLDRSGQYVGGLSREDFRVYENGREAEIVDFLGMESNRPVDVVMLIDISGSMSNEIEAVKNSAIYFAELLRFRQRDSAFGLVTYVDDVEQVFGGRSLTRNVAEFQGWVGSVRTNNKGRENPVQAIGLASRLNFRPGAQRVFLLISDEPPNVPFDPKTRMNTDSAGTLMLSQQVTFYSITPADPSYNRMVETTRGNLFDINQAARSYGFPALMEHIANLLSLQYEISYRSPRGLARGSSRTVRVRVDSPGVWVDEGSMAHELVALFADPQQSCSLAAVTRTTGVLTSSNCGATWAPLFGQPSPLPEIVDAHGVWASDGTVYLHTADDKVWVVVARGRLIEPRGTELGPIRLVRTSAASSQEVWALSGRTLHTSDDAGATWDEVDTMSLDVDALDLAIPPGENARPCVVDRSKGVKCFGCRSAPPLCLTWHILV